MKSTYLYDEKFRFASQTGALVGCEGIPQDVSFVLLVPCVHVVLLAMGQNHQQEAVILTVVQPTCCNHRKY